MIERGIEEGGRRGLEGVRVEGGRRMGLGGLGWALRGGGRLGEVPTTYSFDNPVLRLDN